MIIKERIRNWLGITELIDAKQDSINTPGYTEYSILLNKQREFTIKLAALTQEVNSLSEKLRPDISQRLAQAKSALEITTSFLNEIHAEIKRK